MIHLLVTSTVLLMVDNSLNVLQTQIDNIEAGIEVDLSQVGNILPAQDNTYDIGSPINKFANIYAQNLVAGDLTFTETTSAVSGDTINVGDMLTLYVSQTDGTTHTVPIGLGTALNTNDYGSNNIYFNTTGNVGIGMASTTEAQGKLHLYKSTASGDERFLTMQNTLADGNISYQTHIDVGTGDLSFSSNNSSAALINSAYSSWNMKIGGATDTFGIQRSPSGSLAYADVLSIQSDGNIGISTTTPQASFHITDTAGASTDYLFMVSTTTSSGSSEYFSISADGNITQTGNLNITGYASSTTGLFTQGNIYSGGNATTSGSHYIGGDLTAGDIMPLADNTYLLGTSSLRWKDINVGPGTINIWTRNDDNWEKGYLGFLMM